MVLNVKFLILIQKLCLLLFITLLFGDLETAVRILQGFPLNFPGIMIQLDPKGVVSILSTQNLSWLNNSE